jgi:hypothetical protein
LRLPYVQAVQKGAEQKAEQGTSRELQTEKANKRNNANKTIKTKAVPKN